MNSDVDMIPREPPFGPPLAALVANAAADDVVVLADSTPMRRRAFFHVGGDPNPPARFLLQMTADYFRSYTAPPFAVYRLPAVTLFGADGALLHKGAAIPDSIKHINLTNPATLVEAFSDHTSIRLKAATAAPRSLTGPGFLIGFRASWWNYAHWMQESMPILYAFTLLRDQFPWLRIVLPTFAPGSYQEQTVALFGIAEDEIARVATGETIEFEHAWLATPLDVWDVPPFVRRAANALAAKVPLDQPGLVEADRLYLHRATGARRVANFDAINAMRKGWGFKVAAFENATVATQIATMRGARFVVGEHGAGLVNLLFCRDGTRVIELFNPVCVQPEFWSVASASGHDFGYIVGTHAPTPSQPEPGWDTDYDIVPAVLERGLRALLCLAEPYTETLRRVQQTLRPRTYLQIGADDGASWSQAACCTIVVDPVFDTLPALPPGLGRPALHLYRMAPADFFAGVNPAAVLGAPLDLVLLQQTTGCVALLRDFVVAEQHARPDGIVAIPGCLPVAGGATIGDSWRVARLLKRRRPDLKLIALDADPQGLLLISRFDAGNSTLARHQDAMAAEMLNWDFAATGPEAFAKEMEVVSASLLQNEAWLRGQYPGFAHAISTAP